MISIDKYTVVVLNVHTQTERNLLIDSNSAIEAHKKTLLFVSSLAEEIIRIINLEGKIVYSIQDGFSE